MTNNTRSSQGPLVALVLTTLTAACMSDPTVGITLAPDAGPLSVNPDSGGTAGTAGSGGMGGITSAGGGGMGGTTTPLGGNTAIYTTGGTGGGTAPTSFIFPSGGRRAVDILFVVDNSPSMDPKQAALAAAFPKMIATLQQLPGGLPDVHIGVVSSNMGAGNGAMGGNCGTGLGDRGLLWGNDPNDLTASVAAGSAYTPTIPGCGLNLGQRWIEDIQDPNSLGRIQNYDSANHQLADVFSCLARAVGVSGCGEEHQLQATRIALIPQGGVNMANAGFLRSDADLAIVLVTDEDDCSASNDNSQNDDIFNMVTKRDVGDTTSLRCAARGHLCGGQPIPNYNPSVGYTGTAPFTHSFADCSAKSQIDRNNPDHTYLPLIDVQDMIDSVNWLKAPASSSKIFVSGIIGWPSNTDPSSVQYQIGKDTTSLPPSQQTLWDYMPICTVPSIQSADGNIYKAYGGLRLKKFIDAFGINGKVFSICNPEFTDAMTQTGGVLASAMTSDGGCVPSALADTDPNTPGIQPECLVVDELACSVPGGCSINGYQQNTLSECADIEGGTSIGPLNPANPQISNVPDGERPCWYLWYDTDPVTGCSGAPNGQRISVLRPTGSVAPAGSELVVKCQTCPASNPGCTAPAP